MVQFLIYSQHFLLKTEPIISFGKNYILEVDEHKNLAHFYWIKKIIWIGPGPDRSSNLGPKTEKTGPKTDTGPVFARTDPTLSYLANFQMPRNIAF